MRRLIALGLLVSVLGCAQRDSKAKPETNAKLGPRLQDTRLETAGTDLALAKLYADRTEQIGTGRLFESAEALSELGRHLSLRKLENASHALKIGRAHV